VQVAIWVRYITVSSQWANNLNPYLVESRTTAFHTLLKKIPTSYAKQWTKDGTFVTPLMESIGGNVYTLAPNTDTTAMAEFTAEIFVEDWAYNLKGKAVKLSCMILAAYAVLALVHIWFTFQKGMTSQAWDSVAEVIALAMQSRPTEALRNTSAGITTATVFTRMVKVVQTGESGEHLE
jgi:hypothetical protein